MFNHKHLLSIDDLSSDDIMTVLEQARKFEEVNERSIKKVPALRGKTVCNLFLNLPPELEALLNLQKRDSLVIRSTPEEALLQP